MEDYPQTKKKVVASVTLLHFFNNLYASGVMRAITLDCQIESRRVVMLSQKKNRVGLLKMKEWRWEVASDGKRRNKRGEGPLKWKG